MNKKVQVYGRLHTPGGCFLLLTPYPVVSDAWQGVGCYRFVGVPAYECNDGVYPSPRDIVTNSFAIEYDLSIETITIEIDKFPE
jgi:hypothetical protein